MAICVRPQGPHRLRIVGVESGSAAAKTICTFLAERPEVQRFEQRPKTGVFCVDYDDRSELPGRFLRALNERIASIERPPPEDSKLFDIERVHSVEGRVRLRVRGLDEESIPKLTAFIAVLEGVEHAVASPSGTVLVHYDGSAATEDQIVDQLCESHPVDWPAEPPRGTVLRWGGAVTDTIVLAAAISGAFPVPVISVGVVCCMARPLLRSLHALGRGSVTIDLLDVVATSAALVTGLPGTAAFIIWMVGCGDLLLDFTADQARGALAKVMQLQERDAFRVLENGEVERVRVDCLEVGDRFLASTGRNVAADGVVVTGTASIDEASLTGESRYVCKTEGSSVYASTLVVEGEVVVEVVRSGKTTEAAKILGVLSNAGSKPLTLQDDALRLAGRLVPPTFGVAAAAARLSADIHRATCVLITDFGTGTRIAVPTSALTSLTLAAREGVLVKGAQYLERLAKTDVVVFDKTGTLTCGVPEIVEIIAADGFDPLEVAQLAASAESRHEHPVAKALKAYALGLGCELLPTELGAEEYLVGSGLTTHVDGRTVRIGSAAWMERMGHDLSRFHIALERLVENEISTVFIDVDGKLAGIAGYRDTIRGESAAIVHRLKAGGRRQIVLLSGDTRRTVEWVARKVGVDQSVGPLLAVEKADWVRKLRAEGHVVAMIGDGINDAPALALADVGISIAGSTEVAVEMADVVLMEGGLTQLAEAFDIADRAMSGVRRSLGAILVPNAIAIALGAGGLIRPPLAAIINNGATLLSVAVGTAPLTVAPSTPFTRRQREEAIRSHVQRATILAGFLGVLPFMHDPLLSSLFLHLFRHIARAHDMFGSQLPWRKIVRTMMNALGARHAAILPIQWVPGVALVARATTAAALGQILGRYMVAACHDPEHVPIIEARVFLSVMRKIVRNTPAHLLAQRS
jgi:Cu2+-exporting ATPase